MQEVLEKITKPFLVSSYECKSASIHSIKFVNSERGLKLF